MTMRGMIAVALLLWVPVAAGAQPFGDKVPGAIWKYERSRASGRGEPRTGRFRIEGSNIYQPRGEKREPTVVGRIEGKERGRAKAGSTVTVIFDALGGSDGKSLSAKGTIEPRQGEVKGDLVDADGVHWTFKAFRIRE